MDNSDPLVPFGLAVILVVGLSIAIPFFRGKSDLLTAWNTLLLGVIVFAGLGSIEVNYVPALKWEHLQWFQPTAQEVHWYMLSTGTFIVTLLAAYYLNTPAKLFAQKRLRKWPEVTAPVTFFILGYCLVMLVASILLRGVTFIGPVLFNLAQVAAPAASVFSFRLWYRNRLNVGWLLLFLGVFLGAAMYAMIVSGGHRLLLSVFLGPFLYTYWIYLRHWGRIRVIVVLGLAAVLILGVSAIYSKFRYYNLTAGGGRSASSIVGQMRELRAKGDWFTVFMKGPLQYFGQGTGQFALLTQRYVAQGVLPPIPLNTIRFLVTYPIPRNVWHGKPDLLSMRITRDAAQMPYTNWGCGIAGHGAFEGGIPALMLYAVLLAIGIRIMDEPLRLQPDNPFLIYMLASSVPHLAAITRGDMGGMTMQTGQCVLFAVLLGIACRVIFGTQRNPLPRRANSRQEEYGAYRVVPKPRVNP